MPEGFKSIAEILNKEPALAAVRKVIKQSDVVVEFSAIFPEFKKLVRAKKVEKNILFLKVENSVLRSELKFKETLLVDKINKFFNEERIRGIRFI
ncbi:MAG TPA: DUF721 domain-containing protein [Ignavibacteriaceae bacterium]|nr:DUF721 domain-containing protein [Ignavibacteriaceae bacterium]